jgi:hypothetical protein
VDPVAFTGKIFYRLILNEASGSRKYSRVIQLNRQAPQTIGLVNVINPFNQTLEFDITSQSDARVEAELLDVFGRIVRKATYNIRTGTNALSMHNTETLADGTYIFRVKNNEVMFIRKVLKKNL